MSDFTRNMAPINRAVLEALKPMGRMDGDMATSSVYEASTIEAWRRECELLRKENADIKAKFNSVVEEFEAQVEMKRTNIKRLTEENEQLKAECERLRQALAVSDRDGKFMAQKLEEAMCRIRFVESCDSDEVRRLKAESEQLKRQLAQADRNCEELQEEREAAKRLRDQANAECQRLKADSAAEFHSQARRDLADENDALRIIVGHLAKIL